MNNPYDQIKLSHLYVLCDTMANTQIRYIGNIKRKYLEKALAFDETLSFLEDLKIIKNNTVELILLKNISLIRNSVDDFKNKFLPVLFSAKGKVSDGLKDFLFNFQTETDKIFFKATELEKLKYSSIRNLLIEMEFIAVSEDNTTYFVNPDYADLFVKQFSRRILSPETLKRKQAENDSIGLTAEKAVIDYEVKRLTNISLVPSEIAHTSQENVLAGYDIKSFENNLDSNSKRIDRYIEVKAVSVEDFKFYWSRNEMEIAKVFGEKYFLYLLPVVSNNTFDFEKLIIVNNPFKNIYSNGLEWKKEEESISFSKNISD